MCLNEMNTMLNLNHLLSNVLGSNNDWRFQLLRNWQSIVGSLETRIRLEKIYDATLVIGVYEAHWMQELFMLSKVLLDSINKNLDKPRITQLKFKLVEEIKKKKMFESRQRSYSRNFKLSSEHRCALASLNDSELSKALEGFLVRCMEE